MLKGERLDKDKGRDKYRRQDQFQGWSSKGAAILRTIENATTREDNKQIMVMIKTIHTID
jgi:hypothetical protein